MNQENNDDYDPHDYREVAKPTKNWQAFMHFLKGSIGTGVLAMPNAFANAGYINGIISTILIAAIAVYCLHILISSMYELCKRKRVPYLSYSHAMKAGFEDGPPIFKCFTVFITPFVDGFLALYHFLICAVYVVFTASSFKQIFDEYVAVFDLRIHMCMMLVPLSLIFSITSLKVLAPFSALANCLFLIGFGVVLYYIFQDLPSLSTRDTFVSIAKFPIFFGTVLFALEAVGVILAIEENMETPKAYKTTFGVMNVGMAIVATVYAALGFLGYWKYGSDSLGSVTLNIPQDEKLSQVTKIIFAITVVISYALQGYVTADIVWNKYLSKRFADKHLLYELITRFTIVILSFIVALAVPNLGLFLSLVGAFCLSILGIIFPAVLQICVQYSSGYGPGKIYLIKNILIFMFGAIGGALGTYTSVSDIIAHYSEN